MEKTVTVKREIKTDDEAYCCDDCQYCWTHGRCSLIENQGVVRKLDAAVNKFKRTAACIAAEKEATWKRR